ncbi:MAG: hypothetical protein MJ246_03355 [Clostridia bacterium]|nr:hypothetical protein [Clostridia bacterium]
MIDKSLEEILECDINENFEDLSDKEIEILNYIRNNKEASSSEIAMYINMSTRSAIRLLNSLLEKDKIVRTTNKLNDKTAKYKLK